MMADESPNKVELSNAFYSDGIEKITLLITGMVIAIGLLIALMLYIYLSKPAPVIFRTNNDFRVLTPVPLPEPYLSAADVLQWVSTTLPHAFIYDFNHYQDQLKQATPYFTANGYQVLLNQLNIYANYAQMVANKVFISASPSGAPFIINQGNLNGRYAWWVQMPIYLNYAGYLPPPNKILTLQVLVVRVSTLDNLDGVAIDNVIVANSSLNNPNVLNG
jgi:intracellular multiplication protein IcmL